MIMIADYNRTDVSLEPIFDGTSHCKHHSDMDIPWYVFVYVPSGYFCHQMFYYTHHNDTDAPQYVYVGVTSDAAVA
jgi:hypothetical protein